MTAVPIIATTEFENSVVIDSPVEDPNIIVLIYATSAFNSSISATCEVIKSDFNILVSI